MACFGGQSRGKWRRPIPPSHLDNNFESPMSDNIFLIQGEDQLVQMESQPYDSEALLQTLLAKFPDLLAGGQIDNATPRQWLLVKREMGIPAEQAAADRWSVDHLFLDQDAIPTLVEVKRSSDTRIRREVVGQMLDYAANAVVYWPVEQIRAEFEKNNDNPERRLGDFIGDDSDPDEFWQRVKTNLQAGKIRMLFVADVIPQELRRIIEFLNEQMDPAEVLGIEIKQYVGESMRTLVPRVIGQTAEAEGKKKGVSGRKTDEVRQEFWMAFYELATKQSLRPAPGKPSGETAITFLTDDPDIHLTGRADRNMGQLSIGFGLEGANAQARWEIMKKYLEQSGDSLKNTWTCGHGKKKEGFVIFASTALHLDAKEQWPQQHQWLIDRARELHDSLLPVISQIK